MAIICDFTTFIVLRELERNFQSGRHIGELPEDLAQAMLANLGNDVDLNEEIEGEVAI